MGSGSGVLAIAAARRTRIPALAIDIDPEAVRVTRANARRNGVAIWSRRSVPVPRRRPLGHRRSRLSGGTTI